MSIITISINWTYFSISYIISYLQAKEKNNLADYVKSSSVFEAHWSAVIYLGLRQKPVSYQITLPSSYNAFNRELKKQNLILIITLKHHVWIYISFAFTKINARLNIFFYINIQQRLSETWAWRTLEQHVPTLISTWCYHHFQ